MITRKQIEKAIANLIAFIFVGICLYLIYAIATGQGLFGLVPW